MQPFNLDAALAGAPVVTRTGKKVNRVLLLPDGVYYPVLVHLEGYDSVYQTGRDGIVGWLLPYLGDNSDYDLFMAPVKRTVYVNLWDSPSFHYGIYPTRWDAETATGKSYTGRVFNRLNSEPIPIEIEE